MLMVDRSAFLSLQATCLLEPLRSPATRKEKMTFIIQCFFVTKVNVFMFHFLGKPLKISMLVFHKQASKTVLVL